MKLTVGCVYMGYFFDGEDIVTDCGHYHFKILEQLPRWDEKEKRMVKMYIALKLDIGLSKDDNGCYWFNQLGVSNLGHGMEYGLKRKIKKDSNNGRYIGE